MRTFPMLVPLAGLLVGAALLAVPAQAQSGGRACFRQAEAFGHALTGMGNLAQDAMNPSPTVQAATALRNQGMEACNAGKIKEGRMLIEQATAKLKG